MGLIRVLLAISVVLGHSSSLFGVSLVGGPAAVQSFYVISGFYMALVINEKYPAGAQGYALFLSQRFTRLYPAYLTVLIATCVALLVFRGRSAFADWWGPQSPLSAGSFLAVLLPNLFIFGQDLLMFVGIHPDTGSLYLTPDFRSAALPAMKFLLIPQAWTLGVELAFYVIAPLVVRRPWRVVTLIAASFATRIGLAIVFGLRFDPWSYRFFPSEMGLFLFGSLAYHFYRMAKTKQWMLSKWGPIALAIMLCAIFFLLKTSLPVRSLLLALLMACCVPALFSWTKSNAVDRWLGELSYPIYVCHMLAAYVLAQFTPISGIKLLAVTLPLATLILIAVDQPVDRWRQQRLVQATNGRQHSV